MIATRTHIKFFLLEEDCDWCLAYLFTGIRRGADMEAAQRTFHRYFKDKIT